jgi:hypothetical protein
LNLYDTEKVANAKQGGPNKRLNTIKVRLPSLENYIIQIRNLTPAPFLQNLHKKLLINFTDHWLRYLQVILVSPANIADHFLSNPH